MPTGQYKIVFISGGPAGSVLTDISPSSTQTLLPGQTITFTLQFAPIVVNQPPNAGFTVTSGSQSANEGQSLALSVPVGGTANVAFSATRSSDPDGGTVTAWEWKINGTIASTASSFTSALAVGSSTVTLVVSDNNGAQSNAAQGTVVVTEGTATCSPNFTDDFNRPDGPVGKGWLNTAGNINGNLVIRNGALSTPGPDGSAGVYRPINLSGPVTVSATMTHGNGYGGLLNRYGHNFELINDSGIPTGYGVEIGRSDQNYADSRVVVNGTLLYSSFQFGTSITTTFTISPDGSITGSVSGSGNTFNFSAGPISGMLPGSNLAIGLGFPDARSSVITNPTVDDLTIAHSCGYSWQPITTDSGDIYNYFRGNYDVAYDSDRNQVVLFGGSVNPPCSINCSYQSNDTWLWQDTKWQQVFPSNAPSERSGYAMAYDEEHKVTILFGGVHNDPFDPLGAPLQNDTWIWDGTIWTKNPVGVAPSQRTSHRMVFDRARKKIVLFGGCVGSHTSTCVLSNDVWTWDGSVWEQLATIGSPSARREFDMAYDYTREQVVLYGGYDGIQECFDTWVLDQDNKWSLRTPMRSPAEQRVQNHTMEFDPRIGGVVLMGRAEALGWVTWLWNGIDWIEMTTTAVPPKYPFSSGILVFDRSGGQMLLLGAVDSTAWRLITYSGNVVVQ